MLFSTPADRNEFVDPPNADQSAAVLILGGERLNCRLIEIAVGGFSVVIPRATVWTGEPIARLITNATSFKVRILHQEARYDGFVVVLQRIDEPVTKRSTATQAWINLASRCCAVGVILAIGYCVGFAPGGTTHMAARSVTLQSMVDYWLDSCLPSSPAVTIRVAEEQRTTPMISVSLDDSDDPPVAMSVSSLTLDGSIDSSESESGEPVPVVTDRRVLVQKSIAIANSHRSRPLTSETVPWLFPASVQTSTRMAGCRITRPAEDDLRTFSACLKTLSATAAADAVASLTRTIRSIPSSATSQVDGLPQVRSIRSDDAEIYFRWVDGEIELLRILPIETKEPVPTRSPSARGKSISVHR